MARPTKRASRYGKYVFRRKRGDTVQIFARVGYYDNAGLWKYQYKACATEEEAEVEALKIIKEHEERGLAAIDGKKFTFEQAADWYKEKYLIPPVYENGQQTAGLRTYSDERLKIERLKLYFGKRKIVSITAEDLLKFRTYQLKVKKVKNATANRNLETLRAMFRKFKIKRWIKENPFDYSEEKLIRKSLENRRTVTVTEEQERRILEYAGNSKIECLRTLIMALRDSGARPSELYPVCTYKVNFDELAKNIIHWHKNGINSDEQVYFPLVWWKLFEFEFQVVPLISCKSRQIEFRFGTMTERLKLAFMELWENSEKDPRALVFPYTSFHDEWDIVRKAAGVPELRLRDWRRIWRSNANLAGIPDHVAQRMMGHKQLQTTYHYAEADLRAVIDAGKILDEFTIVSESIN